MEKINLDEHFEVLKNAVKQSHLNNQPHLDLTIIPASQRLHYQKSLIIINDAISKGHISEDEVKAILGL